MGLADFLAEASGDQGLGRAMGGKSENRKRIDQFTDIEVPKLYDAIKGATTRQELQAVTMQAMQAWGKAGLPVQGFEKFSEGLIGPALQNLNATEIESIRRDYAPRPAEARPEGTEGPMTQQGNFVDPQAARNPLADPEGAMRMGQALGANPEQFRHMLEAPAEIAMKETSQKQTAQNVETEQKKQADYDTLSDQPIEGTGGVSARMVARGGGITQLLQQPGRQEALDIKRQGMEQGLDLRRQGLDVQRERIQALADRVASGQATAAERADLAREKLDLEKEKFEQVKRGSETVTETQIPPTESATLLSDIASDSYKQGAKTAEAIQKVAARRGYTLKQVEGGEPIAVSGGGGRLGAALGGRVSEAFLGPELPSLTGDFTIEPKRKTVTKTPAPGANVMRQKSKSGQSIISTDGGKTWRYE